MTAYDCDLICPHCNKAIEVDDILDTREYEDSEYGSSFCSSEYWDTYRIVCPHCGQRVRYHEVYEFAGYEADGDFE